MTSKRTHSVESIPCSSGDEQNAAKRSKITDPYCWLCHENNTNVNCTTCQRSYHAECVGSKSKKEYQCVVCIREDLAKNNEAKWHEKLNDLNELLEHITDRLFESDEFIAISCNYFDAKLPANTDIVNAFDLRYLREKVRQSKYETPLQFLNDIRWMKHNIIASGNTSELSVAKRLEQFCKKEIYDIEMCADCFKRSNTKKVWFTGVCDPPHMLVWARVSRRSPYKPAKVIGVGNKLCKKIDVRFFGDHDMARVSPTDCYLYSKVNPNTKADEKTMLDLMKSLEEVNAYIKNIECKFKCAIVKAESKSPFDVSKISEHLKNMVPFLELPVDYKLKMKPIYLNPPQRCRGPIRSQRRSKPSGSKNNLANLLESLQEAVVVLENCDSLVERYKKKNTDEVEHDESTDEREHNEMEHDEVAYQSLEHEDCESTSNMNVDQSTNDETLDQVSDDENVVIISDDDEQSLAGTNNNHSKSDSEAEEEKPFTEQNEEEPHGVLITTNEPMDLSEPTTVEGESDGDIDDDDMETVSNHSETPSMANNGNVDEVVEESVVIDDDFPANVSGANPDISDTDDINETTDNSVVKNEVTINDSQSLADECVTITEDQEMALIATRSSNLIEDDNVLVTIVDNAGGAEELIDHSPEQIVENPTQVDEPNHEQLQDCLASTQEVTQNDNEVEHVDHEQESADHDVMLDESIQTLPNPSQDVLPTAQSTPFKSLEPPVVTTPAIIIPPASTLLKPIENHSTSLKPDDPQPQSNHSTPLKSNDPQPQSSPQKSVDSVENNEITINECQEMAKKHAEHIASLQIELEKKTVAYQDLVKQTEDNLKRLESLEASTKRQTEILIKDLTAKQDELDKMKRDHAAELLKVIAETKKKMWCRACENEVVYLFQGVLVCSPKCFQVLWAEKHETRDQSSTDSAIHSPVDQAHIDIQSLVADLLNDIPANDQTTTARPNTSPSEAEEPEEHDDPLGADLRDF